MIRSDLFRGWRSDTLTTLALVGAFLAAAAAAGLVIAIGKPVMIALAGGALLGLVLVNAPAVAMWIVLVGVMLVSGPAVFHIDAFQRVPWLFAMLGFFLAGVALLHALLVHHQPRIKVPAFVQLMLLFVAYGLLSLAWIDDALSVGFAGIKRYYQFFGIAFALAAIDFRPDTVRRWVKFFLVLALLQLPYVMYQRFVLVPGMGWSLDGVNGTYEALRTGVGNSGSMAYTQVVVLAALLAAWWERLIGAGTAIALGLLVVGSLLLAEVNVIFVIIPFAISLAMIDVIKRHPMVFMTLMTTGMVLLAVGGMSYLMWQQENGSGGPRYSLKEKLTVMMEYNFGERGYAGDRDANRTTVYRIWWREHSLKDPVPMLLGHGLGTTNRTEGQRTVLTTKFPATNISLVSASQLLWELGLTGFLLFLAIIVSAIRAAMRLLDTSPPGFERMVARSLLAATGCTLVYLVYSDSLLIQPTQEVLMTFQLGLLAWIIKRRQMVGARMAAPAAERDTPAARPSVWATAPGRGGGFVPTDPITAARTTSQAASAADGTAKPLLVENTSP